MLGNLMQVGCGCCNISLCLCTKEATPVLLKLTYSTTTIPSMPAGVYRFAYMGPPAALASYASFLYGGTHISIGNAYWAQGYFANGRMNYPMLGCDPNGDITVFVLYDTGTTAARAYNFSYQYGTLGNDCRPYYFRFQSLSPASILETG
jgi:hypothetical protein